jgi:urease accessory protein UreF
MALVRLEGLGQLKIQKISLRVEPATFQSLEQCLNPRSRQETEVEAFASINQRQVCKI